MPSTTPCFSMNSVQLLRTWGTAKRKTACHHCCPGSRVGWLFVSGVWIQSLYNFLVTAMEKHFSSWGWKHLNLEKKNKYILKSLKKYFTSLFDAVGWPLTYFLLQCSFVDVANSVIKCFLRVRQPITCARLQSTMPVILCWRWTDKKRKTSEKHRASSFSFSTMNHRDMLFIHVCVCVCVCVCVWEIRVMCVCLKGGSQDSHSSHIIQRMTQSGTLSAAAVQMNSSHSRRENKARFEETRWHSVRLINPFQVLHAGFCYEVLLSPRYTTCFWMCSQLIHFNSSYNKESNFQLVWLIMLFLIQQKMCLKQTPVGKWNSLQTESNVGLLVKCHSSNEGLSTVASSV